MEAQTQYPPLSQNQMPQWSRVGQLDKSRYPKTITKDQLMPQLSSSDNSDSESLSGVDKLEDQNPAVRVEYLERSIKFLKAQHQDILSSLHAEIEKLRNSNKGWYATIAPHNPISTNCTLLLFYGNPPVVMWIVISCTILSWKKAEESYDQNFMI